MYCWSETSDFDGNELNLMVIVHHGTIVDLVLSYFCPFFGGLLLCLTHAGGVGGHVNKGFGCGSLASTTPRIMVMEMEGYGDW